METHDEDKSFEGVSRCALYTKYAEYLNANCCVTPKDPGRWRDAIPLGARIGYLRQMTGPLVIYDGGGRVRLQNYETCSLNEWCNGLQPGNNKTQRSAPQCCHVQMRDGTDYYAVPIKLFDYLYVERLAEDETIPVEFVFDYVSYKRAPDYEGLVDRLEREFEEAELGDCDDDDDDDNVPVVRARPRKRRRRTTRERLEALMRARDVAAQQPFPVAYGAPTTAFDLTKLQKATIWRAFYGSKMKARCFMCGDSRIRFGKSDYHGAHVVSRARGGVNWVTYNRGPTCITCNQGGSQDNMFDQLCSAGRADMIGPVATALMLLYCQSESHVNVHFANRMDFVQRVFGRGEEVEGGVECSQVWDVLSAWDQDSPVEPHLRNPRFYMAYMAQRFEQQQRQ